MQQAAYYLEGKGYDMSRAGVYQNGYYIGFAWNAVYSGTAELIALNID